MSRVLTFSRTFPAYHPKAGENTYFVEKVWKSLGSFDSKYKDPFIGEDFKKSIVWGYQLVEGCKYHTIRAGNRWKVGDKFSPRVWSGKPYNSKMITIAPDIEIKEIFKIRIWRESLLNWRIYINDIGINSRKITELANNDGLSHKDLLDWFNVPINKIFEGQIICWNDKIEY